MYEWIITTNIGTYGEHPVSPEHVRAAYLKVTEGNDFVEFKDYNHKTVYMVSSRHVVSISRVMSDDKDSEQEFIWTTRDVP
jgi:hypothetical protein